jgi:hypothetical protein
LFYLAKQYQQAHLRNLWPQECAKNRREKVNRVFALFSHLFSPSLTKSYPNILKKDFFGAISEEKSIISDSIFFEAKCCARK